MNFDLIGEYLPLYVDALWLTLRIAFFGIVYSLILGLVCALIQYLRVPLLRHIVGFYIELSRNTPLLVQLFFIYYGLPKLGIVWSSETCAIVGLTFLGGSYMAEAFRSGFDSVEKIQMESALSLGMKTAVAIRHVLIPQALATAFPGITANIIFLIKETSVVSIIALPDLMFVTRDIIGSDYNTWVALGMLVFFYMIILLPISLIAARIERRLRHAGFGN
ncbi:amino acid ABC transporter permease [Actinomycetaceae bacterium L2_0104]